MDDELKDIINSDLKPYLAGGYDTIYASKKITIIDRLFKYIKDNPTEEKGYYYRAVVYYKNSRYRDAIVDLNMVIKLNNKSTDAYNLHGVITYKLGDIYKAIKSFEKAIELNSHYNVALYNLGDCYLDLKKYEKALNYYDKSLEAGFKNGDIYHKKAIALLYLNKVIDAKKNIIEAIKLESDTYNNSIQKDGNTFSDVFDSNFEFDSLITDRSGYNSWLNKTKIEAERELKGFSSNRIDSEEIVDLSSLGLINKGSDPIDVKVDKSESDVLDTDIKIVKDEKFDDKSELELEGNENIGDKLDDFSYSNSEELELKDYENNDNLENNKSKNRKVISNKEYFNLKIDDD